MSIESRSKNWFSWLADVITAVAGSSAGFFTAVAVVLVWLTLGPVCHYSDTWQLTINTGTSVVTFLMVFLIQKTQNRDARAIHLKLNELVAAVEGASNSLISAEELGEEDLHAIRERFLKLAQISTGDRIATGTHSVEEVPAAEEAAGAVAGAVNTSPSSG